MSSAALAALVLVASGRAATAGPIGLGAELGHPTGLTLETAFGDKLAFQAGVGTGVFRGTGVHVHAELLYFAARLADDGGKSVPLYVGGGLRVWDHHYDPLTRYDNGRDTHVGLIVPVGVALQLKDRPFDFFFQVAVAFDVKSGNGCSNLAPSTTLCRDDSPIDAMFGIGFHYYFGRSR